MRRGDRAALRTWAAASHNHTSARLGLDAAPHALFGSAATAALVPESILGPYYVEGGRMRGDLADGQAGVAAHLELQFVDVGSCGPAAGLLVDVWHANATGAYSGVAAAGQGGLDSTHGRGAQRTDGDGVVHFDSVFPGHYRGRANHVHVMATAGADVLPDGSVRGGTACHIGQAYFDDALVRAVEATEPYRRNPAPADGLLLWMTIGIDPAANHSRRRKAAARWRPSGGVDLTRARP